MLFQHPPCADASETFADENHVGGLPIEEVERAADTVSVAGVFDVDDDVVVVGREDGFDQMVDGRLLRTQGG